MVDRYRSYSNRHTESGQCVKRSITTGAVLATYNGSCQQGSYADCWDTVGEWDQDNPFLLKKVSQYYPTLSGSYPTVPYPKWEFTGEYPITGQYSAIDPESRFPVPSVAELQGMASHGAAMSNPCRPHIGLPTALGELRDLPKMLAQIPNAIRSRGGQFLSDLLGSRKRSGFSGLGNPAQWLKDAAAANLAWRFGWAPFISDLSKMLGVTDAIAKRLAMLGNLAAGKSIRRRFNWPVESSEYDEGQKCTQSIGALLYHRKVTLFTCHRWVSTQWKLASGATLPSTPDEMANLAGRLAMGLNGPGGLAAAWELTPWSWLHDWFFGLGDWLAANNNALPITLAGSCFMQHSASMTLMTASASNPAWVLCKGPYWMGMEVKRRIPLGSVLPLLPSIPTLPSLTGGQLGILGSLAVQLGLRR
jgi:hypothetical protein